MKNDELKKEVRFFSYYKFIFTFEDDEGNFYETEGDADDIYRFNVSRENVLERNKEGEFFIDGLKVTKF